MSIQDKYEQMLYPTVRIETDKGSGSGVAIDTHGGYTVILTARHVVKDAKKVRVRFYPSETEYVAQVTKISKDYDLAIITVLNYEHDHVTNWVDPYELLIFQDTYKVGAALGSENLRVTEGLVSEVWEYGFVTSSPVVWGDSGGGIFVKDGDEYVLVGITSALAVAFGTIPVFHIGYAVDMFAVEEFLNEDL